MATLTVTALDDVYNSFYLRAGKKELLAEAMANVLGGMYGETEKDWAAALKGEEDEEGEEVDAFKAIKGKPAQQKAILKVLTGEFTITVDEAGVVTFKLNEDDKED